MKILSPDFPPFFRIFMKFLYITGLLILKIIFIKNVHYYIRDSFIKQSKIKLENVNYIVPALERGIYKINILFCKCNTEIRFLEKLAESLALLGLVFLNINIKLFNFLEIYL